MPQFYVAGLSATDGTPLSAPSADGTSGQAMTTDGSGQLTFTTLASAGASGTVQVSDGAGGFNDSGIAVSGTETTFPGDVDIGTAQLNFGHPQYYVYRNGGSVTFEAGGAYAFRQSGTTKMTIGSTGVVISDGGCF